MKTVMIKRERRHVQVTGKLKDSAGALVDLRNTVQVDEGGTKRPKCGTEERSCMLREIKQHLDIYG